MGRASSTCEPPARVAGARGVWLACAALLVAVLAGCGSGTTAAADCDEVGKALERVWRSETNDAITAPGSFAAYARREGTELVKSFVARCKSNLTGQPLAPGELACLRAATTGAEVVRCAHP